MDIVITYVDGMDPLWQEDYERTVGKSVRDKRFRDWGTLPYLFRGIERNMPFVDKVHLVVARDSQVPAWVDRSQVHIVFHEDIIPADKLPLFNASSIEMFLQFVPGLSEEFIFLNDDFYPMLPMEAEDFFVDGKAVCHMSGMHMFTYGHNYRRACRRSTDGAAKAAGLRRPLFFIRPQHIAAPMLKTPFMELYSKMEEEILSTVTPLREPQNYNQYLFVDYIYYKGLTVDKKISKKHFSLASSSAEKICAFIDKPTRKWCCINDVDMSEETFQRTDSMILEAFQRLFPQKSRFEL